MTQQAADSLTIVENSVQYMPINGRHFYDTAAILDFVLS